jgi:hypothetical protein
MTMNFSLQSKYSIIKAFELRKAYCMFELNDDEIPQENWAKQQNSKKKFPPTFASKFFLFFFYFYLCRKSS